VEPALAAGIFLVTYALIASDRIDRTTVALAGGLTMVVLGIIDQDEAFGAIDFNVIFLLAGMMILAGILRRTGFFQWIAIRVVRISRGEPLRLLILLAVVTAVLSAFLDNVTTVVLVAPVTLYVASVLGISPVPFLVAQILASNIGGSATLIGDPPNILIGSASGLDFAEFLFNMAPAAIIIMVTFVLLAPLLFRRQLEGTVNGADALLAIDDTAVINDPALLRKALVVLALTIVAFMFQGPLGLETATIALLGATVLLLVTGIDPEPAFREVDWPTLFFFVGLFMLVEGIVATGIVRSIGESLIEATGGESIPTTIGLLWLSGIASGVVDNIPYTVTMIPVVQQLGDSGVAIEPLWWSLALGACLGGNATIVGASANVVVANLSGRAGQPIGFLHFLRLGLLVSALSLIISTVYVWVRYLI
jgi:Na+/H+ antiporter NhaD/arsenite permease-like protein